MYSNEEEFLKSSTKLPRKKEHLEKEEYEEGLPEGLEGLDEISKDEEETIEEAPSTSDKTESTDKSFDISDLPAGVDWITYFIETTNMMTDAHVRFKEAEALFLISTFVKKVWKFVDSEIQDLPLDDIASGEIEMPGSFLNLWIILIGRSRRARKTTVAIKIGYNKFVRLLMRPYRKYITRKTGGMKKKGDTKEGQETQEYFITPCLPENFNPSSLFRDLNDRYDEKTKTTWATWINDELLRTIRRAQKSDYMAGLFEDLSKFYDGDSQDLSTRGRGIERVESPYITCMLCATKSLTKFVKEEDLEQGFWNRPLYAWDNPKERPANVKPDLHSEKIVKRLKILYKWIEALDRTYGDIFLVIEKGSQEESYYNNYLEDNHKKGVKGFYDDIEDSYFASFPNFLIKLASIYRISRLTREDLENQDFSYKIKIEDFQRAAEFINYSFESFKKFVDLTYQKSYVGAIRSERGLFKEVCRIIKKKADKNGWALHSDVLHGCYKFANQFHTTIVSLRQMKVIKIEERKTTGRPGKYYKVVKDV